MGLWIRKAHQIIHFIKSGKLETLRVWYRFNKNPNYKVKTKDMYFIFH